MSIDQLLEILKGMEPKDLDAVKTMLMDCFPYYYMHSSHDIPVEYNEGLLKRLDNLCRGRRITFDEEAVAKALQVK